MLRHYFTLKRIAAELKQLEGYYLEECFTQEKDSAVFVFNDGTSRKYLSVYTDPQKASVSIRENLARAKKNTTDILPALIEDILQNVYVVKNDRIIKLEFIYSNVYIVMFNHPHTNIIITKKNNIILEALNKSTELQGKEYVVATPAFKDFTDHPGFTSLYPALSSSSYMLGKYYAKELLNRLNLKEETKVGALDEDDISSIRKEADNIINECLYGAKAYLLKDKKENLLLSLIPLKDFDIVEEFDSVSEAVRRRLIDAIKERKYESLQKDLRSKLERQYDKTIDLLKRFKNKADAEQRIENYRLYADLLMAQQSPQLKGADFIDAIDFHGNHLKIKLEPKLNMIENAKYYYAKAKKASDELKKNEERIPLLERRLNNLQKVINKVDTAESAAMLEKIKKEIEQKRSGKMDNSTDKSGGRFRTFDFGGGFILYVGKNAANNDELTVKFAKPDDLWFHARGASGSHCVLRWSGTEKPPKEIMQKSAALAAYYSQARKAKHVPVAYALKKYVRKPKGANPGSVIMAKEDVIMADPKSPEDLGFRED